MSLRKQIEEFEAELKAVNAACDDLSQRLELRCDCAPGTHFEGTYCGDAVYGEINGKKYLLATGIHLIPAE